MMDFRNEDIDLFCELSPGAVAIYQVRPDFIRMMAFSDGLAELLGLTREEYARRGGEDITNLIVKQDRDHVRNAIATSLGEHRDVNCSYRAILEDGSYHWMNVRGHHAGESGGFPIFMAEFLDTTLETQMHMNLLDNASNGIYICDEVTRELFYVNQKAMDFWERSGVDFRDHTCHEFFRGREGVCPWCICNDLADKPISIVSTDDPDHEGILKITCSRIPWHGRPSFCISFDDVTGVREAQRELRDIVENIPAALLVYREAGGTISLTQANGAVEEIAGLSGSEIVGQGNEQGINEHVHPEDAQVVQDGLERMFSDEHEAEFAYRNRPTENVPFRWIHFRGRSYPQYDGTQVGYAVITDFTSSMETKQLNDKFVSIIANLPVISMLMEFVKGGIARPVSFSDEFCRMLGITQKQAWDLYGNDALSAVHPDDRANLETFALAHMRDADMKSSVHRFVRPDGKIVWVTANYSFFNVNGRFYGYMVYTDITAMKEEEAELRRRYLEEQGYLDSVSSSYLAAARVNLTRNTVEEVSGISSLIPDDTHGLTYDALLEDYILNSLATDEDRASAMNVLPRSRLLLVSSQGKRTIAFEGRVRFRNDADAVWASISVAFVRSPDSDDVICFVTANDIEDKKTDQQIFDRIMSRDECDFVAIIDARRRTIDFRKVAENMAIDPIKGTLDYDVTSRENARQYVREEDREESLRAVSIETIVERLSKEATYTVALTLVDRSGKSHRKLLRYSYLDRESNKILTIRTDITETYIKERAYTERLREAYRNAEAANVAKSEFLSRMSHDIRTPLNGIIGMTRIAKEQDRSPVIDDCLNKIDLSSKFLLGLVNDVLDMSKAESGSMELHPEPYLLADFADYINSVIRPLSEERDQTFVMETHPVTSVVPIIDVLRLNQIMFNLLSNAVKYTPEGGTISVRVDNRLVGGHREELVATVKDDGIGMSEEFQKILFEPFTQEGRNGTFETKGSGLGLSIVKKLVDLMGGTITCESAIGKGTTFVVTLTFDYIEADQATWRKDDGTRGPDYSVLSGRHVLLCEDHPLNQEIAVHLLEQRDMLVTTAEDGQLGVKAFEDSPIGYYDIILMDVRMPVMNGLEATRAIRGLSRPDARTIPIVAMTADAYADDVRNCLDAGMNGHVAKPVDPAILMSVLVKECTSG